MAFEMLAALVSFATLIIVWAFAPNSPVTKEAAEPTPTPAPAAQREVLA
jgi:hypothetical protein